MISYPTRLKPLFYHRNSQERYRLDASNLWVLPARYTGLSSSCIKPVGNSSTSIKPVGNSLSFIKSERTHADIALMTANKVYELKV